MTVGTLGVAIGCINKSCHGKIKTVAHEFAAGVSVPKGLLRQLVTSPLSGVANSNPRDERLAG